MIALGKRNILFLSIIAFVLWIALTGVLVWQNQTIKHKLTRKQIQALKLKTENAHFIDRDSLLMKENELEGLSFQLHPHVLLSDTAKLVKDLTHNSNYSIIILFSRLGCQNCLDNELVQWQKIYERFDDLSIFGVTGGNYPYRLYKNVRIFAKYPFYLDTNEKSFLERHQISQPTVLLLDNNLNRIIYAHCAQVNNMKKTQDFIEKVLRFLPVDS